MPIQPERLSGSWSLETLRIAELKVNGLVGVASGFALTTIRRSTVAKKTPGKKPKGWRKFDDRTKNLIQVPKDEIDAQIERDKRERAKKRKKKKRKK